MKRTVSAASDARRKVDRLRALRNSPEQLHDFAIEVIATEGSPQLLKLALESLGEHVRSPDGPILREVYADFDRDGARKDPGGDVRVEVLKALWHLRSSDDIGLATRARNTSERTLQGNGEMIRAAGLALLGVLDPERGAVEAILVLGKDPLEPPLAPSDMNGEPALTAARLLTSLGETNALLLYVLGGSAPTGDVVGEALRGLTALDPRVLEPILLGLLQQEDEGLLVAVCDVLVELPVSERTISIVAKLLDSPTRGEVYEFVVSSIVASRRQDLIGMVIEALPREMSHKRLRSAHAALELAPQTPEVEQALSELSARLARQAPPR